MPAKADQACFKERSALSVVPISRRNSKQIEEASRSGIIQFNDPRQKDDIDDVETLKKYIREKIVGFSRTDTVQKVATYQAFLRAGGQRGVGIPKKTFRGRLKMWGIRPTTKCYDKWWTFADTDGSGDLDFLEFYAIAVPKDYGDASTEHSLHRIVRGFAESSKTTMNDILLAAQGARKIHRDKEEDTFKMLDAQHRHNKSALTADQIADVIKLKMIQRTRAAANL
jgi:Ca2+-binding EF-hand superfamily protein